MRVLLSYYSRSGVTRKATETMAEALRSTEGTEVEVEEIAEETDRRGLMGWLRAGRDALRKRSTSIGPVKQDPTGFELVVIGGPVWAWTAATPVQAYCRDHGSTAKAVAFYCTMGGSGEKGAFQVMESLCAKAPVATLALIDRHVKKDNAEKFETKVKAFVSELLGKCSR